MYFANIQQPANFWHTVLAEKILGCPEYPYLHTPIFPKLYIPIQNTQDFFFFSPKESSVVVWKSG